MPKSNEPALLCVLRVSQGWEEAQRNLCQIFGTPDCVQRLMRDPRTGVVTADFQESELGENEGARLLRDLIASRRVYDLSFGPTVNTRGGTINVNHIENLDPNSDWRFGKGKGPTWLPATGVDAQVAFNSDNVDPVSENSLRPAERYTVVFHELAEAFAKIDKGMPYMVKGRPQQGAHQDAMEREKSLRSQRPELYEYNIGSGPGTNYHVKTRMKRQP